jgi:hypothetical protein
VPQHVARLVTRLVAPLVVDYSASRRLVVDYSASRKLIVDNSASCRLVVDYFASAVRPGASARRAARHAACRAARHRLLHLRCMSGCLGTSRGSSLVVDNSTSRRLVARLVVPLVVDYSASRRLVVDYSASRSLVFDSFAYAARLGASAHRAAHRSSSTTPRRAGSSCGSLRRSSSTTSPTQRIRVPRHVARLVTRLIAPLVVDYSASRRLVVDYFAYAVRSGASAPCSARRRPRAIFAARLLVGRSHWLSPCAGHSVSRLGYSSPGCTGSTAYVVHPDAPSSLLDNSTLVASTVCPGSTAKSFI